MLTAIATRLTTLVVISGIIMIAITLFNNAMSKDEVLYSLVREAQNTAKHAFEIYDQTYGKRWGAGIYKTVKNAEDTYVKNHPCRPGWIVDLFDKLMGSTGDLSNCTYAKGFEPHVDDSLYNMYMLNLEIVEQNNKHKNDSVNVAVARARSAFSKLNTYYDQKGKNKFNTGKLVKTVFPILAVMLALSYINNMASGWMKSQPATAAAPKAKRSTT